MLAVSEHERGLPVGNVERFIGVGVEVNGRPGLSWRERSDLGHVGALHLGRSEQSDHRTG
jgi:hypothetical protein